MAKQKGMFKRGSVWWLRYAGPDGKIRRESSHSGSYKTAQVLLINRKKEVQEGREPIPAIKIGNHSFRELSAHYLEWAKRQRSFDSKKYFIQALVNEFGNCLLRRFTTRMVEEFQSKVITSGRKPATANRYLATLKHMFTKAVEWEMVEKTSDERVKRVKHLPENNRRLRFLSIEESQILIDSCPSHLKPIVVTALNSGMRKEEILSLEWDKHIDLRHGFILLDMTKNGSRREIPINATLSRTLNDIPRRLNSPYVFANDEGRRFKEIKRSFNTALRKAGIKDFTFHDLRHSFASQLIMKGADLVTVKELLGHSSLAMVLRYAHLSRGHKSKAVELLDIDPQVKPTAQKLHSFTKNGLTLAG